MHCFKGFHFKSCGRFRLWFFSTSAKNFISWVKGKCCLWTKVVIFHHLTFSFESKVADPAYVRPHVRVGPDVFFQHAGLLAADPALLTNVFSPASASDIHIIFVGFIPERQIREYS